MTKMRTEIHYKIISIISLVNLLILIRWIKYDFYKILSGNYI